MKTKKPEMDLDKSRMTEWNKWMKFMAVQIVSGTALAKLLKEGHKPIPTQWIDNDKNEHLKRPGQKHTPLFKSRLVARGDLEQSYSDIRTDSPTAEVEALSMVRSMDAENLQHRHHECIFPRNDTRQIDASETTTGWTTRQEYTRRFHDVGTCAYLRHQRRWKKVLGKAEESPNRHWTTPEFPVQSTFHLPGRWRHQGDDRMPRG